MTEQDWLAGTNPDQLIGQVCNDRRYLGRFPHHRKWRLFFCACCRRLWHLLADPASRQAVEASEQCAEGAVGEDGLARACTTAYQAQGRLDQEHRSAAAAQQHELQLLSLAAGVAALAAEPELEMVQDVLYKAWEVVRAEAWGLGRADADSAPEREAAYQSGLIRDIIGNPFRPLTLNPNWLTADVVRLAQAAYDQRTLPAGTLEPARLALLADALEDAGCTDADLLGHLRGGGPHVRGCWAVDALLGKE
jgi:hypothetical protein